MSTISHASRIAGWLLASAIASAGTSVSSTAAADPPNPAEQSQPEQREDGANKPDAAASKTKPTAAGNVKDADLIVSVTGNGRPIGNADVKIKFPTPPGGDETRPTDAQGTVQFKSSATGAATVFVFAKGWVSFRQEFTLKKGAQSLSLQLTRQPGEN